MRFMSMLKFDETKSFGPPPPELFTAMGAYTEEGLRNGTVVEIGGYCPARLGRSCRWSTAQSRRWMARSPRPASWSVGTR